MARILAAVTATLMLAFCTMRSLVSCFDSKLCAGADDKGRCSPVSFPEPASDGQEKLFTHLREDMFYYGTLTGCHSRDFYDEAGHDDHQFPVFASFSCDENPTNATDVKCTQCFSDGFAVLKTGCPGRAGGTVWLADCRVRYEIYDICK